MSIWNVEFILNTIILYAEPYNLKPRHLDFILTHCHFFLQGSEIIMLKAVYFIGIVLLGTAISFGKQIILLLSFSNFFDWISLLLLISGVTYVTIPLSIYSQHVKKILIIIHIHFDLSKKSLIVKYTHSYARSHYVSLINYKTIFHLRSWRQFFLKHFMYLIHIQAV